MPSFPSPIVNGFFDEVPVCAVLAVREEPGAAEAEHEDQRRRDVNPKVDDHDVWKDVDRAIALERIFDAGTADDPDGACDKPADLEADVERQQEDDQVVAPFWQCRHPTAQPWVDLVEEEVKNRGQKTCKRNSS